MPEEQTPEPAVVAVVVHNLELAAGRKMELVAEQRLDVVAVAVVDFRQTGLCQNEFLIRIIVARFIR